MSLQTSFLSDLPGIDAQVIVPSDTVNQGPYRALYVGVAGDVVLVTLNGNAVTFKSCPVGILDVACIRINSTNTHATDMVGIT